MFLHVCLLSVHSLTITSNHMPEEEQGCLEQLLLQEEEGAFPGW